MKIFLIVAVIAAVALLGSTIGLGVAYGKAKNSYSNCTTTLPATPPPEPLLNCSDTEVVKVRASMMNMVKTTMESQYDSLFGLYKELGRDQQSFDEALTNLKQYTVDLNSIEDFELHLYSRCYGALPSISEELGITSRTYEYDRLTKWLDQYGFVKDRDFAGNIGSDVYCADINLYHSADNNNLAEPIVTWIRNAAETDSANDALMASGISNQFYQGQQEYNIQKVRLESFIAIKTHSEENCNKGTVNWSNLDEPYYPSGSFSGTEIEERLVFLRDKVAITYQ